MEALAIFLVLLLLLGAAAPVLYSLHRRLGARQGELEFWRVLQRRGLSVADTARDPRSLGMAVRRCVLCPNTDTCVHWLASDSRTSLEDFCPNAGYLRKLERS